MEQEKINQPKSVEIDGQKIEQHSLKDQIAADRYVKSQDAIKQKNRGLKLSKFSAGGA